jgi:dienelactone hydrolase
VDASREDDQGTREDHKREFMVHVWYPAQKGAEGKPAPWIPAEWARLEDKGVLGMRLRGPGLPKGIDVEKVLGSVVARARQGVAVADSPKRFPVIVFSPGSLMFPSEYSSLVEDLASRGYVVIGDVATGYVHAVSFPDGSVTPSFKKPNPGLWSGDVTHMLDRLGAWNTTPGHLFFGRLDLERIGAFGHSAGASAVATIPGHDGRVKAVVLIDPGSVRPEDGPAIPTLVFKSESVEFRRRNPEVAREKERNQSAYLQSAMPGIQITLLGAEHLSFTDMAVIKEFAFPGDGRAFIDTSRAVLGEFFGRYLLGKESELIEKGSGTYPLARVDERH